MIGSINFCLLNVCSQLSIFKNASRTIFLSSTFLGWTPPRHRISDEHKYRKRTNVKHFHPYVKSWHNIILCDSCGHYHRKWILCPTCYDQTRFETQAVRKFLKEKGENLSEETVLKYKNDGEQSKFTKKAARIISVEDRNRPTGWFNEKYWNKM